MERMRELVQQTTSGSTELAASADQMSKMSRELLDFMGRFALEHKEQARHPGESSFVEEASWRAAAGSRG